MGIKVIGIGDSGVASILPTYQQWIDESELLVGGERMLDFFPNFQGEKRSITSGLSSLVEELKNETRQTVVLASGDPLFYGIGSYLSKKLPIELYPSVSSIQLAFARIGEGWQDATMISVHGRSMTGLAQKIDGQKKIVLLTDHENSPSIIAKYLLSYGMDEYEMFVGENLGGEKERTGWWTLTDACEHSFSPLNVVVLKQVKNGPVWSLGIDDHEFYQRKPEKGLITKKEVRTLSVSALELTDTSVVWDVGTCTGSVAIEAARISRHGSVYAIEKNEGDLANCYLNMHKFRTDFTAVLGKAPDRLQEFPDPDAVFIGGTAGDMNGILDQSCERLKPNGRIVLNAVTIENMMDAVRGFKERGFAVDIMLIQASRSKPILNLTRFDALNPIYIITARRETEEEK
ncbi:precorrin-6y C5,15-methyltransferase (decarboxylating) subunit CbiE [Priestia koreensis]|uniref:precorrin-6y C5,15-methyltransferase (decarboxylating) subunit CbiE n=1 Tax=Priestia koreensis TaxID=284581 RepID=UPI00203A4EE1|nr:precorrin-6y C5,15-methyltransferase (decarboxylating) subunit CbiE [Priestia koreensis]